MTAEAQARAALRDISIDEFPGTEPVIVTSSQTGFGNDFFLVILSRGDQERTSS